MSARVQKTARTARRRLAVVERHFSDSAVNPSARLLPRPRRTTCSLPAFSIVDIESFNEVAENVEVFVPGFADLLFDAVALLIQRA